MTDYLRLHEDLEGHHGRLEALEVLLLWLTVSRA